MDEPEGFVADRDNDVLSKNDEIDKDWLVQIDEQVGKSAVDSAKINIEDDKKPASNEASDAQNSS